GARGFNCGSLTGEQKRGLAAGPASRCLQETPIRGAPDSSRPPNIRQREPDAWAAETDGTRECERGGRYGRPFSLQAAPQGKMVVCPTRRLPQNIATGA